MFTKPAKEHRPVVFFPQLDFLYHKQLIPYVVLHKTCKLCAGKAHNDLARRFFKSGGDGCQPLIPMGKLIQPEDIAETVLFLASEQAKMITGQVIKVSGGKAL